jgi:hypothetical protein
MHGYGLAVPSDCTAANSARIVRATLAHMKTTLGARVTESTRLRFDRA